MAVGWRDASFHRLLIRLECTWTSPVGAARALASPPNLARDNKAPERRNGEQNSRLALPFRKFRTRIISSVNVRSPRHGPPGQSPLARRILGLARLRCSGPPSDACPKDKRCDAVWRQDQRKHSKDHERRRFHQDLRDQRQARSRDRACPDSARVVWRVKSYSSSLRFKDGAAAACARAWTGAPTAARGALLQRFPAKAAAARNPRIAGIRSARFAGHCGAQDRGCGAGDEGRTPALGRCRRFVRLAPRAAQRRSQPAQACATDTDT
jgi:hypothetical protein